jgi:ATP-binding cassette subfamily F protein 3
MAILNASRVGQSFGEFDVFSGVSVSIPRDGKIGLVGPNGVGKTTLLLLLAGQAQPSAGTIHLARGTRIGYLSQESSDAFIGESAAQTVYDEMLAVFAGLRAMEERLRVLEHEMGRSPAAAPSAPAPSDAAPAPSDAVPDELLDEYSRLQVEYEIGGGYDYDTRIRMVLTGLGFAPSAWSQPLSQLSGGQKTRVLLGRLLLEAPDLLILDEPTNHLDVQAIEWLENTLNTWPGAVLVVSHDRYFLDRVAKTIWEMSRAGWRAIAVTTAPT